MQEWKKNYCYTQFNISNTHHDCWSLDQSVWLIGLEWRIKTNYCCCCCGCCKKKPKKNRIIELGRFFFLCVAGGTPFPSNVAICIKFTFNFLYIERIWSSNLYKHIIYKLYVHTYASPFFFLSLSHSLSQSLSNLCCFKWRHTLLMCTIQVHRSSYVVFFFFFRILCVLV